MEKQYMFIGNASKSGITTYLFKGGNLQFVSSTLDFERCTYLIQDENYMFAVQEIGDENNCGYVISYKKTSKGLMYINKKSSGGSNPCHIEISPKNRILFISNYRDGYFSAYKINSNGSIGKLIHNEVINSKISHLHCAKVFNNEHNVITVDLGMDILTVYEINSDKLLKISSMKLERGHNSISVFKYENNKLELLQNILSYGNTPRNLEIDKTEKYLLVANQDSDEISIYSRNKKTGKLDFIEKQNTLLPTCILSE